MSDFILTDFSDSDTLNRLKEDGYYKIVWAKEKDVELEIDGSHLKVYKDCIIFCTPNNKIDVTVGTSGVIAYMFNREFYCIRDHDNEVSCNGLLFYGSSLPPVVELMEFDLRCFNMMHEMFEKEFGLRDSLQGEMLRTILKHILIMSTRMVKEVMEISSLNTEKIDLIRNFNLLVEMHFRTKHKVKDYADILNKSPKTLSNIFHQYGKRSPLKVIADRISLEAQRLIMFSDKNLTEISDELGFNDISHFSKFFKKHTTHSPSKYKELLLSKRN